MPWYHYIPLSYGYDELYSILAYYFGTPSGSIEAHDDELRQVSTRGKQWVEEHGMWEQHAVGFLPRSASFTRN